MNGVWEERSWEEVWAFLYLKDGVVLSSVFGVITLQKTPACGVTRSRKLRQVEISKTQLYREPKQHTFRKEIQFILDFANRKNIKNKRHQSFWIKKLNKRVNAFMNRSALLIHKQNRIQTQCSRVIYFQPFLCYQYFIILSELSTWWITNALC